MARCNNGGMTDLVHLREYLSVALLLGACSSTTTTAPPPQQVPVGSTPVVATAASDAGAPVEEIVASDAGAAPDRGPPLVVARPPDYEDLPRASCPSYDWCGTAAQTKPYATKEATDQLGCKTVVSIYDDVKGAIKKAPKWWPSPNATTMVFDTVATQAKRDAKDATTCCYKWIEPCPGGRALIVDGAIVRAPVHGVATDDALATAWLADAQAEHASIASFARAVLELMAVGGPPALLDELAVAMRDEIRHAELCFAIAARYAGGQVGPGPLPAAPPREAELVRFACDTFLEGCVGETVAVVVATRALAGCEDAEIARALRTIVDDETRHAALAWRTLAWAFEAGGDRVRDAVRALAIAPVRATTGAIDQRLAAHGRLDEASAIRAEREAWREVVLPTLANIVATKAHIA